MRNESSELSAFERVHGAILRQHTEIRARMRGIDRLAVAAGRHDSLGHLRIALGHFAALFEQHLAFEERELGPLLRAMDSWGPVRENDMIEEHRGQRQRVEALFVLPEDDTAATMSELRGEVHWLMKTLTEDMDHEDADLRTLERSEREGVAQMTG